MEDEDVSRYGLTLTEYDVLESVWLVGGMHDRSRLLRHVLFMDSARETSQVSLASAETALDACLVNGRVKTLTPEDCLRDKARWAEEPNQAVSECEYQEGFLDFTAEGAQLWNRMQKEQAEVSGKRMEWGVCYAWRFPGQVRVFSAWEDELRDAVEAIREGKDVLYTGEFHIERMEGPFALSEWWINRFLRLPQGYRMDIYCTEWAAIMRMTQPDSCVAPGDSSE